MKKEKKEECVQCGVCECTVGGSGGSCGGGHSENEKTYEAMQTQKKVRERGEKKAAVFSGTRSLNHQWTD